MSISEQSESILDENEEMEVDDNKTETFAMNGKDINHFELGNGNVHFLPGKLNYTGYTNVDVFFDPLIKSGNFVIKL